MEKNSEIISNFLNLYWIRPETVLWRSLDAILLKKVAFSKPIIDIGCGDGSFSFTNFGGSTSISFDVYRTIPKTRDFFKGVDIHDQFNNVKPNITKKPRIKIDVGLDWKENLLNKARNYNIYQKLVKHDVNKPLPFKDEQFETVFSNIFYWLNNIHSALVEASRICTENGRIVIFVPDKKFQKTLIFNYFLQKKQIWAKILDRGIYSNIKHCYTHTEWKKIFSQADLKIENHVNYLSENLIKFWNIGLRPYSPFIIEMVNILKIENRVRIKKRLLNELIPIFKSYIEYELSLKGQKNCFHLYVLSKV